MMPRKCLASAITFATAKRLASGSPSVAITIKRGTQEIQPILLLGFISRKPTREAAE